MGDKSKASSLALAFTYAGCFLGAGFVSGQELWQFFGCFGKSGIWGGIISILGITLFGILFFDFSRRGVTLEQMFFTCKSRFPGKIFSELQALLMYGILIIMLAGGGALISQSFGVSHALGSGFLAVCVLIIAFGGVGAMLRAFSFTVPLITGASLAVFIILLAKGDISSFSFKEAEGSSNPLLFSPAISSVSYLSYNLFGTLGIMESLRECIPSKRKTSFAMAGSFIILTVAGGCSLLPQFICRGAPSEELPMLFAAHGISPVLEKLYALLLLFGMLGTSFSSLIATEKWCVDTFPRIGRINSKLFLFLLCAVAWVLSLAGFGELVGTVYPIFGYIGAAALLLIVFNYFRYIIKNKGQ